MPTNDILLIVLGLILLTFVAFDFWHNRDLRLSLLLAALISLGLGAASVVGLEPPIWVLVGFFILIFFLNLQRLER